MSRKGTPTPDEVRVLVKAYLKSRSEQLSRNYAREAHATLAAHENVRNRTKRRVRKLWGRAIDSLTHLVIRCWQIGGSAAQARRDLDACDQVLLSLWGRGCQTAFAICSLLEDGFADDAHARWRTLHELNVVAQLIRQHGAPLAERYLAHLDVKNYKVACEYERCAPALGYPALDPSELPELKAKHDAAVMQHPGLDQGDWGWALPAFPPGASKKRLSFPQLESAVGLEKWRAHVGMAHHNVHGGPHGAFFRLGSVSSPHQRMIPAGPSIYGLADPGHACAISLHQLTFQFAVPRKETAEPGFEHLAATKALGRLVDVCGQKFAAADARSKAAKPRDASAVSMAISPKPTSRRTRPKV